VSIDERILQPRRVKIKPFNELRHHRVPNTGLRNPLQHTPPELEDAAQRHSYRFRPCCFAIASKALTVRTQLQRSTVEAAGKYLADFARKSTIRRIATFGLSGRRDRGHHCRLPSSPQSKSML